MTAADLTSDGFHPEFADFADAMAADRIRTYPARVAAREFSQGEADHRIFVMRAIAEVWRCAADNLMPQKFALRLTKAEVLDTLDKALDLAQRRVRLRPDIPLYQRQHDQLKAMRWWHGHFGEKAHALNMALSLRYEALQRSAKADRARAAA